ncbi:glycerophosphodiester phosphodiesterase family protein [Evansella tamaricis]|uniref:Glycerophosphodiester phosphodiesterase n=1 Tax=Evansella tamaricis TaxID=2069301 RepID=A0ABS6JEH5_9BACI|nr:glycerophosphodiester phosphodiesterase family protein [Evansella tamaricis]MBU9712075.1 glycerophosphodiester phosphodiesterase [Evansella tamaricis]
MEIIAHRGNKRYTPENTMASFYSAMTYPIDGIELDVQFTKDGIPVVIHDDKIDRTTNGRGYVRSFSFQEIRQFDAGTWFHERFRGEKIPSLKEVFQWASDKQVSLHVELKKQKRNSTEYLTQCLKLITNLHLEDRVIISTFYFPYLKFFKERQPKIETALITKNPILRSYHYLNHIGADAIHIRNTYHATQFYKYWSMKGIPVRPYNVHKIKDALKCQRLDVQGIITNDPKQMADIFRSECKTS